MKLGLGLGILTPQMGDPATLAIDAMTSAWSQANTASWTTAMIASPPSASLSRFRS